jgi:hypothetical protein
MSNVEMRPLILTTLYCNTSVFVAIIMKGVFHCYGVIQCRAYQRERSPG